MLNLRFPKNIYSFLNRDNGMGSPFKDRSSQKSLGTYFFHFQISRASRANLFFAKIPPIFTREPIFCQNFLRAAREPILMFFMYDFAPKIHWKLKIPQIFPALRAGTYFLPKFSRASRANLFFSILKI